MAPCHDIYPSRVVIIHFRHLTRPLSIASLTNQPKHMDATWNSPTVFDRHQALAVDIQPCCPCQWAVWGESGSGQKGWVKKERHVHYLCWGKFSHISEFSIWSYRCIIMLEENNTASLCYPQYYEGFSSGICVRQDCNIWFELLG